MLNQCFPFKDDEIKNGVFIMQTRDMTQGKPAKLLLTFALPIFAGNLFQQLYNMADTVIVGHILGDSALAAVGATSSVYSLIVTLVGGLCNGFSISIAKFFGSKNEEQLKKAVGIAIVLGISITAFMTLFGLGISMPLLRLLNTPEEIIGQSNSYLRILYAFMIFTMLYNLSAGMLRALGNSFMPLIFLIISVAANVGLDVVFVYFFGMGVAGAALATVISLFFT